MAQTTIIWFYIRMIFRYHAFVFPTCIHLPQNRMQHRPESRVWVDQVIGIGYVNNENRKSILIGIR